MPPPSTIPEVIARLQEIETAAPRTDGVACFARLYRQVTEGVDAEVAGRGFEDGRFLERLDVCFAGLFFDALEAYERDPTSAPSAWVPLFEQRSRRGVTPLQFALAGMNAHINRDLPVALVTTCSELGLELHEGSPEQADFERVNVLLAQVEAKIKHLYLSGWLAFVDRIVHRLHRIDDIVAMWNVGRARDAAWTNGHALWVLRDEHLLATEFLDVLDRMVGFAGRGLLVPADTVIQKLLRLLRRSSG
jgi:Family of unknown function (DUF5995)